VCHYFNKLLSIYLLGTENTKHCPKPPAYRLYPKGINQSTKLHHQQLQHIVIFAYYVVPIKIIMWAIYTLQLFVMHWLSIQSFAQFSITVETTMCHETVKIQLPFRISSNFVCKKISPPWHTAVLFGTCHQSAAKGNQLASCHYMTDH